MWKKLKSRGAETVEYAIVLACIAAFGLMFSDNLTHTLETLMGKTGSIITNGSTNKGDKDDETDKDDTDKNDPNVAINNKNMDWLKGTFFDAMTNENNADRIKNYIGGYSDKNTEPNFIKTNGLIDSDSNSQFLKDIGLLNAGGLENSSWAFAGYKNEYGDLCYGVSIYNKEKNNGQSLADKGKGDKITTDIYTVNTKTNEVTLIKQNVQTQYVGKNDKGTVNVIRGDYK
ncbi:hypothetical protein [uncultured Phascolarctobacterium sp.]|uniref:hypothetical protein n=1 Tax=uncultured Phascolarctobacterium sp. TaxID=512296 RepID=UPI00261B3897|nr:hypothetical protein [uncultured Phascolarctobacterium sp.]